MLVIILVGVIAVVTGGAAAHGADGHTHGAVAKVAETAHAEDGHTHAADDGHTH